MLNKIFGMFKSSTSSLKENLSQVTLTGILFKKVIGKKKEELSSECELTLALVNDKTYDYNLIVQNSDGKIYIFILDTDWERVVFAVTNDLGVKMCKENGKETLIWERNKEFYFFYLLLDDNNKKHKDLFIKTLAELICSNDYSVDMNVVKADDAQDFVTYLGEVQNLDSFIEENYSQIYAPSPSDSIKINDNKDLINIDQITNDFDKKVSVTQLYFKKAYPNATQLFISNGALYLYDNQTDNLTEVSGNAIFQVYRVDTFKYYIVVDDAGSEKTYTCTGISQDTNIIPDRKENLIMWLSKEESGVRAYNFVFYEKNIIDTLRRIVAKTQYETSSNSKFEDLKEDEREWLENANDDEKLEDESEDIEMELDPKFQESVSDNLNKATAQAYLHDRTFVVRENNTIGVYKTDEDDILSVRYIIYISIL